MGNHQYVCGNGKYCNANATTPKPPSTHIVESHQNAYETASEAEGDISLNRYQQRITLASLPIEFINGTFGYQEYYPEVQQPIIYIIGNLNNYQGQLYLFISTGSGGGNGYMYLDWILVTFGIPYEIEIP